MAIVKRLLPVFLLLLFIQSSWAAMIACPHESEAGTQQLSESEHKRSVSKIDPSSRVADFNTYRGDCELDSTDRPGESASELPQRNGAPRPGLIAFYPFLVPDTPERPKWRVPT